MSLDYQAQPEAATTGRKRFGDDWALQLNRYAHGIFNMRFVLRAGGVETCNLLKINDDSVEAPLGTPNAKGAEDLSLAAMNPRRDRKWILIVDDDSSVRLMLSRVLIGEGYGVLTSATAEDALGLAETFSADLLLVDLNMPRTDGWALLRQLEAKKIASAIIIITALPNQQAAAKQAGVEIVLEKPLDFPRLIQTVSQVLAKSANPNLSS